MQNNLSSNGVTQALTNIDSMPTESLPLVQTEPDSKVQLDGLLLAR